MGFNQTGGLRESVNTRNQQRGNQEHNTSLYYTLKFGCYSLFLLTAKKGNKEREQERQKESDDSTSAIAAASAAGIDLGWIGLEVVFVFCCNTYKIISC